MSLSARCSSLPSQSCSMLWAPRAPCPLATQAQVDSQLLVSVEDTSCKDLCSQSSIDQHVSVTTEKKHGNYMCVLSPAGASLSCAV